MLNPQRAEEQAGFHCHAERFSSPTLFTTVTMQDSVTAKRQPHTGRSRLLFASDGRYMQEDRNARHSRRKTQPCTLPPPTYYFNSYSEGNPFLRRHCLQLPKTHFEETEAKVYCRDALAFVCQSASKAKGTAATEFALKENDTHRCRQESGRNSGTLSARDDQSNKSAAKTRKVNVEAKIKTLQRSRTASELTCIHADIQEGKSNEQEDCLHGRYFLPLHMYATFF